MIAQTLYGPIDNAMLANALQSAFADGLPQKALLLVPDYTRLHSQAGAIANQVYHLLADCQVDLLQALGSHQPMTARQIADMYGDIPPERFQVHHWRTDVVKLGQVPREFVREVSDGLVDEPIGVEVNRRLFDGYDLILSIGQVVPHEVVGMANHTKNIFVGCGGSAMINTSHMLGAFYGLERLIGRDRSPVRRVFDYAAEHFLRDLPIWFALTVITLREDAPVMEGLFIGQGRGCFEKAVALSQQKNMTFLGKPLRKVVAMVDAAEFASMWLANKAVYRTRMAIADGGELIVLAPGVHTFGEDPINDTLIRKYGFCGRERVLQLCQTQDDLRASLSAAAHLIHASTDGRFRVTYCTQHLTREEIEGVGFGYLPYDEAVRRYDPSALRDGYNTLPDGEEIYYVSNPALGLWVERGYYERQGTANAHA